MFPDLRFALRQLAKTPGFTALVAVILALAIGGCVTVFSVVNGVVLHPLNYPEAHRLVVIKSVWARNLTVNSSAPDFFDWQAQAKSFSGLAASRAETVALTTDGEPLSLATTAVTANYFDVRRVPALHGRTFAPGEDEPGRDPVVVLSHGLWQRVFGGEISALGRTLRLNDLPHTIVGIMGPEQEVNSTTEAWTAYRWNDNDRTNRARRNLNVVARLAPGVSVAGAQAEIDVIAAQIEKQYNAVNKDMTATVTPMVEVESRPVRALLWSLLGAIGCVLLIGCANVANLLLARATGRSREFAVRAALGASRARLVRQLLLESLLLALLGGTAGILLSLWALDFLRGMSGPTGINRLKTIELDGSMLGFALALTCATGILFGLAPAWLGSQVKLQEALKQGLRGATEGRRRWVLRHGLVVFEVAAALVLLAGAGLFVRSFARLAQFDAGVRLERAIGMTVPLPAAKYDTAAKRRAFVDDLLPRLRALPGVTAAAFTDMLPLQGSRSYSDTMIEGRPWKVANDSPVNLRAIVSPDYFPAAGMRLVRGRLFTAEDRAGSPPVVVISELAAKEFFPNEDPLGQRMHFFASNPTWREIVGIVADVLIVSPDVKPTPQVYESYLQAAPRNPVRFLVRTAGDPAPLLAAMKAQVYAIDKNQVVQNVQPLDDAFGRVIAKPRFGVWLLGWFAALALVIAGVGIYGVIAYSVSQRTGEIGIRMALGAQTTDVLRLVMTQGARLIGLGLLLGIAGALAVGRIVQSQLFQTSAYDPITLGAVAVLLAAAAGLACWAPARRATKVDPIVALRAE